MFGMSDPRFGQRVAAVVGFAAGKRADAAELIAHVRDRLAAYKAPRDIAVVDVVPRAPNGKAEYARAKEMFAQAG